MDGKRSCSDSLFVERLWRRVKYEEVCLKIYRDRSVARASLADRFRSCNIQRPHQGLDYRTPASLHNSGRHNGLTFSQTASNNRGKTAVLHPHSVQVLFQG
jgi:transposase InsO family protein